MQKLYESVFGEKQKHIYYILYSDASLVSEIKYTNVVGLPWIVRRTVLIRT
jgi:hypothetical protein